ncbi:MAG: hypothetical protein LC768_17295, partial [Acidobacteria bacterium]|nr:hypothetical protein [Acidobacteriota bacterium]MCA1640048.1 hypothetical protein [Acidobacteriota bacterium]
MLELLREKKLLKARSKQRTDSTHVLAAIHVMNRLEMVDIMRTALNQLATVSPEWLTQIATSEWFERYSLRAEQSRLPTETKAREAFGLNRHMTQKPNTAAKTSLNGLGYKVHLSETCDEHLPHLITNVHTTVATTQDVASTADIQVMLYQKGLPPSRHLVDAGYIDGDLLVQSVDKYGIELFGPTRVNSSWQMREGTIDATQFE